MGVKQHEADLRTAEIRDRYESTTHHSIGGLSLTEENANGRGKTERTATARSHVRKSGEPCDLNN